MADTVSAGVLNNSLPPAKAPSSARSSSRLNNSLPPAKVAKAPSSARSSSRTHSSRKGGRTSRSGDSKGSSRQAGKIQGAPSSVSGSTRGHLKEKVGGFQHGAGNEDFLASARQVDAMINAIHHEGAHDYVSRLEQAYKDLSKGKSLSTAEVASKAVAAHWRDPPAVGPVPCIVMPPKISSGEETSRLLEAIAKKEMQREQDMVEPPWGPRRANLDRPPQEQIRGRQQHYCKMLDQQTVAKADLVRIKTQQENQLDRETHTSLASDHHKWGHTTSDGTHERAIFRELLATVDYRAKRERAGKEAERRDAVRMAEEMERQLAWQWHVRRAENKQEKDKLSGCWSEAARDRQKRHEAQKSTKLQEEKEVAQRMKQGMVPPRRLRRPREECVISQEMMPPRQTAATPALSLGRVAAWQ